MIEPKPAEPSSSAPAADLRALGELPALPHDPGLGERHRREARAAFVRAVNGTASSGREPLVGLALPLVLAGCVGIYVSWALSAAWSLMF